MGAFGPRSEQEREVFAIEELRADVQLTIQEVMQAKGITRSQLAKSLGCSPANVTQILAEDGNPTLETIARVFYALGDVCKVHSAFLEEHTRRSRPVQQGVGWRIEGHAHADSRSKRLERRPTTDLVIQVARDAMHRHGSGPAHNQNVVDTHRQAA